MSQYDPIVPTIRGRAMLTQALKEGKALLFTKAEWGDGVKQDNQQSEIFTGLIHKVIESGFTNREQDGDTLYLTTVYDNSKLTTGFYVRELGIYARVGADGQEYLFAYTYAPVASYTPASSQYNEKRLKIAIGIDKDATVAIKFNSQQYATREELDIHNKDAASHSAAFTNHNGDAGAHTVIFDNFVKNVARKADNSFTVTKGNGSTENITINNVANANTATSANSVAITHGNEINVNGDISSSVNQLWLGYRSEAGYTGTGLARWKMGNLKGGLADCEAKNFFGNLKGNADSATTAQKSNTQEISDNSDNIATTQFVTKKFNEAITGDTTNSLSSWYAHKWGNRKIVECFGQVTADVSVVDVKFPVTGTPRNIMICDVDYFVETDTPVIPTLSIDGRSISNTGFKIFSTMPTPGAIRWHATLIV